MSGIQGLPLEVTVVACYNLDDKEWLSRQDPYVCLEYGSTKYRTKTCTDGGKNPTFQEKFIFTLIEGLREVSILVWNSHTLSPDEFIASGRIQLHKALSQGYDDTTWSLQDKHGRHSGEVRLMVHCSNATKQTIMAPSAPSYHGPITHVLPNYAVPAHVTAPYSAPSPYATYPPNPMTYPPSAYPPQAYPPPPSAYYYPPGTFSSFFFFGCC